MNRILVLATLIFFARSPQVVGQQLKAELDMARFESPTAGPYLEVYVRLKGHTLAIVPQENGFRSSVILGLDITQDREKVYHEKVIVNGPLLQSDTLPQDFIDAQRVPLKPGKYKVTLTLADANDTLSGEVTASQEIEIISSRGAWGTGIGQQASFDPATGNMSVPQGGGEYNAINYFISDIQPIDDFHPADKPSVLTKSGLELTPYTSNFYPEWKNTLTFYTEVYNTNDPSVSKRSLLGKLPEQSYKYLISIFIENADNGKVVNELAAYFKRDSAKVIPILHSFPIDKLSSGNYDLVVELRTAQNQLLESRSFFFQRYNELKTDSLPMLTMTAEDELELTFVGKYNSPEELEEYLRCLHPISSQLEISAVNQGLRKKTMNLVMMKRFLYNFWKTRNPEDPEKAWLEYWAQVEKVNEAFSTNLKKGYDTDRGRVYLQYGPPNTISQNYFEPNTYPYEIWHYYTLKDGMSADQANRKFIFANVNRGTKEFELIHSDAKNEITNRRWHHDLHNRSTQSINLDVEESGSFSGSRSKEFFENPY